MSPRKSKTLCKHPQCGRLVEARETYCVEHRREREQQRGSSYQRGYDKRWQALRRAHLAFFPLCEECKRNGIVTAAEHVDHIEPFDGVADPRRLDPMNLQSLCRVCHSRKTAMFDGGFGH